MRRTLFRLTFTAALSAAVTTLTGEQPKKPIPVSRIERGMSGYGLSVFQGTKIERFSVKIIGVLRKTGSGSDLILARLSGGPLTRTGVIAGMSGSPVYINHRLIGAVSYAWGFSKETIAGITPIHEMLQIFNYKKGKKRPRFRFLKETGSSIHGQDVALGTASFRRVATPLILSGIRPEIFKLLSPWMKKLGFLPVLGGAAGKSSSGSTANKLPPGSAVGVQLVGGDMNMTGIGTVTYNGPEGILAFGHPMMMRGFCSFPMTSAYIHTVMPSLRISFKMGSPIRIVGSIYQDRTPAIAGKMGIKADTIPIKLQMQYGGKRFQYSYTIIRDRQLFARLLAAVMLNTLTARSAAMGALSCRLRYSFTLENLKTKKRRIVVLSDSWAAFNSKPAYFNALVLLLRPINSILFNPFSHVRLRDVSVAIESLPGIQAIRISDLRCDRKKVRPGETVKLKVELTPWRGTPFWKTVTLKVPLSARNSRIFFVVSSKAHERYYDRFFSPAKYTPTTLEEMVDIYNIDRDATKLAVWSELYQQGLVVNGRKLPNLPESRFKLYTSHQAGFTGFLNARLKKEYTTNYFLYGMKFIFLTMDHRKFE